MFKLELGSCVKRGYFLSNVDSKLGHYEREFQLMGGLGLQEEGLCGQCRIMSQSDIVILHVLPYLVPVQRKYE